MEFTAISASPIRRRTACLVVGVYQGGTQPATTREVDEATAGLISRLIDSGDLKGKAGETHLVTEPPGLAAERLLLVGCGKSAEFTPAGYRKALGAAVNRLSRTGSVDALVALARDGIDGLDPYYLGRQTAETAEAAAYRYDEHKGRHREPRSALKRLTLAQGSRAEATQAGRGLSDGSAIAAGVAFARDLCNRPPNICHPVHLAEQARKLAARHGKTLSCEVLGPAQMKKLGMGALLAVGQGSEQPPRLIVLKYRGAPASQAPAVLVGKAITFDTGGISLKPPQGMDEMKFDMGGGAAILGTMAAVARLAPRQNVIAVVPACENMPSGRATRPGDIVRTLSGQTVEILNTDAEGRLILCDALTYARRFKPAVVVDAATLTGACMMALGHQFSGVFTPHDALADALIAAGERVGDPAWRLPVNGEYGESLKSNFADFANVGAREGGASIAAAFLARFTEGLQWAHLDIAGAAWKGGSEKGATGRPVQLLTEFLLTRQ